VVLIFSDDSRTESGRVFDQQLRRRIPDARVFYIDPRSASGLTEPVMNAVEKADKVIVAIYEVPTAAKIAPGTSGNSVAVPTGPAALLQNVLQSAAPKTAVVSLGSPYVVSQFPGVQTYLCTYSNVKASEVSAVKALFGEIPMPGHLPVTIPDIAQRGAGLAAPAQRPSGGSQ
jgi:beta-N-acetylhexosaminidase